MPSDLQRSCDRIAQRETGVRAAAAGPGRGHRRRACRPRHTRGDADGIGEVRDLSDRRRHHPRRHRRGVAADCPAAGPGRGDRRDGCGRSGAAQLGLARGRARGSTRRVRARVQPSSSSWRPNNSRTRRHSPACKRASLRSSSSTRPTASASGVTTSGRSTFASALSSRRWHILVSWRSPRPRRPRCDGRSSSGWGCASRG